MRLVRLMYFSEIAKRTTEKDVIEIMDLAKNSNEKSGITGALIMSGKYFVQVLEGERRSVSKLIFSIGKDSRHDNVTIISFDEIEFRDFEQWSMTLLSIDDEDEERRVLKHSLSDKLDPTTMRPGAVLRLMKALAIGNYPGRVYQL